MPLRAGVAAVVHLPLQFEGQSDAFAHVAQHHDRGRLDDRSDPDSRRDRDSLVPPSLQGSERAGL